MNAWRSFCAEKRAVTKNDTSRTPAGGCSTNHDIRAVFPVHASARHHA